MSRKLAGTQNRTESGWCNYRDAWFLRGLFTLRDLIRMLGTEISRRCIVRLLHAVTMTRGVWWFVVHLALMEIVAKKVAFVTVLTVSSGFEKQREFSAIYPMRFCMIFTKDTQAWL